MCLLQPLLGQFPCGLLRAATVRKRRAQRQLEIRGQGFGLRLWILGLWILGLGFLGGRSHGVA